jgi:pyruvate/2-oxoglutarate dehydrogenase complex dihydrolipoamide acyltransferase (E2) component
MNSTIKLPAHTVLPFSIERRQIVDFLKIGKAKHTAYAIIELDITGIRNQIRKLGRLKKQPISLTCFLLHCFARAVAADKSMQGYRKGNKLILFDDVDVATMVEQTINGARTPVSYILRRANSKTIFEISSEIKKAKEVKATNLIDSEEFIRKKKFYNIVKQVGFLRRWILKRMSKDPFLKKKINGTVGFSSMGMFTSDLAGWVVPITPHTLTVMVGGIRELPELRNGQLRNREMIDITLAMDHDILDGSPTARFIVLYKKLVSKGVEDLLKEAEVHKD